MPYYTRAFCTDDSCPSIDQLEATLNRDNPAARLDTDDDRESDSWDFAEYYYKEGNQPIVVEINRNHGSESLAAEESQEFIEKIGKPGLSMSKRRVINQLKNTRFIVSCQLLGDIDDDGFHWNGELLNYFVRNHAGMFQADGEGFYDGHKVTVELS
ncbi:MAG: hypothetical protein GKS00_16770 [Alphaproteobacteria bacterium]|nr:hypothetical protein [Alphaproteobacteria bacterium]